MKYNTNNERCDAIQHKKRAMRHNTTQTTSDAKQYNTGDNITYFGLRFFIYFQNLTLNIELS